MTAPQAADDMTELRDAEIDRVDLVGKAANGTKFLIAKGAEDGLTQPLVPADKVRELLAKADGDGDDVAKAELDVADAPAPDDLIPEPPGGTTANSVPGSADWEQLDGDTAMNAVATLGRVKACLGWLADREAQESVTGGDYDSTDNSWDLDSMACSIDYIIGALAAFAVGEHMEADQMEAVGKAVAALADAAAPLAVVEGLAPIAKAGRSLSAANETKIRTAVDSLTEVLNSLPQAPAADDVTKTEETHVAQAGTITVDIKPQFALAGGQPIEKGADLAAELLKSAPALTAVDAFRALLAGGQKVDVTKAKGDPQMAVFSADGKLVGVIDPADLNPIAATEAPSEGDTEGAGDDASADDAPADNAAAAAAAPAAAADDGSAVIPGTNTVQAPAATDDDTQTPAVAKAADAQLEDLVKRATEEVRKGFEAQLAEVKEQVRKIGQQPDDRRSPVLNGGPAAADRDEHGEDGLEALRKAVADAKTDDEKTRANAALAFAEIRARFTR